MKRLDRFILRDVISDGPAGAVYRADEVLPGDNRRPVVLKLLPAIDVGGKEASNEEQRFYGEVRMLAQLTVHPNIVTIYAMGLTGGVPWMAMELGAATLGQRIASDPGDVMEVVKVLGHVGRGLLGMHALKPPLIHQDLKPANVILDVLGNYKITDFSSATAAAAHRTQALATVKYAAPELLSNEFGKIAPATDLYALGHIAYEMALGTRLHRQSFPAVYEGNTTKEPPPNKWMMWHVSIGMKAPPLAEVIRGFPAGISEVISRLMNKPLADRYATAAEMLSDLSVLKQEVGRAPATLALAARSQPAKEPATVAQQAAPPPLPAGQPPARSAQVAPATAAATPAAPLYWVRLRGKITGPFDLPTLQRQVKQGLISRLHQVSTDQVNWKQATDVEGLYGPTVV